MANEEFTRSAYHEAGHVVIAQLRGLQPEYVEVYFNPSTSHWEGTTQLPDDTGMLREEEIEALIAICIAGCFAQVKYTICQLLPDEPIPWKQILEWIGDRH